MKQSADRSPSPDYKEGYVDGWDDAFAVRTAEALALVKMFWHKLTRARLERDNAISAVSFGDDSSEKRILWSAIVRQNAQFYLKHSVDQRIIATLRAEIVRLKAERAHQDKGNVSERT